MLLETIKLYGLVVASAILTFLIGFIIGRLTSHRATWSVKDLEEVLRKLKGGKKDG